MQKISNTFSSFQDINDVVQFNNDDKFGASVTIGNGFHDRNCEVAKSDIVLAFTRGEDGPIDGGTKHTWNKALSNGANCVHFSLAR